jgi:hypothetical protein
MQSGAAEAPRPPHPEANHHNKAAADLLLRLQPKELRVARQLLHQHLVLFKVAERSRAAVDRCSGGSSGGRLLLRSGGGGGGRLL